MSIFTRFKDIIESNIDAMLGKSDNPERMLRLMIQDMEDTLVEMKATCAQEMAEKARTSRTCERVEAEVERWTDRAELALSKGREDLAREALMRKKGVVDDITRMTMEVRAYGVKILECQSEIRQVESKLLEAREKQRVLNDLRNKPPAEAKPKSAAPEKTPEASRPDDEIEKELSELKAKLNNNNSTN